MLFITRELNMGAAAGLVARWPPPLVLSCQSVVKKMLTIGNTDPVVLYDFAVKLEAAFCPHSHCIDQESELYKALCDVYNSVWGQLPNKIVIDFTSDD